MGRRRKVLFCFFNKGRGGSERSESKMFRLQSQKCKGPEVGGCTVKVLDAERGGQFGWSRGKRSRITPEGTG